MEGKTLQFRDAAKKNSVKLGKTHEKPENKHTNKQTNKQTREPSSKSMSRTRKKKLDEKII